MTNKHFFTIIFEGRFRGDLGSFYSIPWTVFSDSIQAAKDAFYEDLERSAIYESNRVIEIREF